MKDKLLALEEAAQAVRDGSLLGLSGSTLDDAPMAFLRELLRQRRQRLRVVTMSGGGLNIDLLIGAGAVEAYETCSCSLDHYGQAPHFQRALRQGSIQMKDST